MPRIVDVRTYTPRFKEGQRVFVTLDSDMGGEQPEGTVLVPGPFTMILVDPEFRLPEFDSGLREYDEDNLEPILEVFNKRQAD